MPFLNYHFVISDNDIYVHSGGEAKSIIDEKLRQFIFGSIDDNAMNYAFLGINVQFKEIYFCYPKQGETIASLALVWNYEHNTWTSRDIQPSYHSASAITPSCLDGLCPTWDTLDTLYENWQVWAGTWAGSGGLQSEILEMVFATNTPSLVQRKTGVGTFTPPLIERLGLDLGDYNEQFTLLTAYPAISRAPALVQIGIQDAEGHPVRWSAPQLFDPTTSKKLDLRGDQLTGSLFSYRIYSEDPSLFEFSGLELDAVPAGKDG